MHSFGTTQLASVQGRGRRAVVVSVLLAGRAIQTPTAAQAFDFILWERAVLTDVATLRGLP